MKRVTVTLDDDLVEEIASIDENRSRFIQIAVVHELERRRREELERSLSAPHAESDEVAEAGLEEWLSAGSNDDDLVDRSQGTKIRWHPGRGWIEVSG
jgi:hypothetical protein